MAFSVVEFYGRNSNYACGYCKQSASCQSHGMWAHKLSCEDYQDLIDRGWRRSGCYCYKPIMDLTCCPSYTIKCDAMNFRLNKSHKKIIKRMNKFLRDGKREKHEAMGMENVELSGETWGHEHIEVPCKPAKPVDLEMLPPSIEATSSGIEATKEGHSVVLDTTKMLDVAKTSNEQTERVAPKKAKLRRIERKREKLQQKGIEGEDLERRMQSRKGRNIEKSLEEFLNDSFIERESPAHRLKVKMVRPKDSATPATFRLYNSYQQQIHNDPISKLTMDRFKRFLINTPIKIVILSTSGIKFKESLDISYALYVKYQTVIHKDPPSSIADYLDFLVKSPLKDLPEYGSFHQQYWIDDRLVAVGVIDILPRCISSVYFFYDPEFKFLSLGTYGSLRELAFTRARYRLNPNIKSYYMGFYIHSCPKMRYKSHLHPSYLLCPEVYTWHLLDKSILTSLDERKYMRLNSDKNVQDGQEPSEQDLRDVLLLIGRSYMRYSEYMLVARNVPDVTEYARLVGKKCSKRMMLYGV